MKRPWITTIRLVVAAATLWLGWGRTAASAPRRGRPNIVFFYDIYPTICELAGIDLPRGLDARSLLPLIQGRRAKVRDYAFTAYRDVQRAVRDDRWKLIRYSRIDKTQLFDLSVDPHEIHDLAAVSEHAAKVKELLEVLAGQQKEYGDACPLVVDHPQPPDWSPPQGKLPGKRARRKGATTAP